LGSAFERVEEAVGNSEACVKLSTMNPAEPLPDAQHERFACLLAKGTGVSAAYVLAGYKESPASATRLSKKVNVAARVEWLQKQAATGDVLDLAEKRRITAEIARTGDKNADRLNAIKVDNDLAGDGSEAKGQGALALLLGRLRG
jgi:hypothetical protein